MALAVIVAAGAFVPLLLWTFSVHVNAQQTNRVPEFREGDSAIRIVEEGTASNENVGEPVEAFDSGDTLTYSLAGDDAGHFSINSGTGQILTSGNLDYDTKGSYSVIVAVTDGADDAGEPDTTIDDTIEITVRVSVPVDLNDWTAEVYGSDTQHCESGRWTVDADGRAKETGGEAPSILYGDFAAYGKRLTATVNPGSDDDFFGFVVGFNGGDSDNSNANYLLIDWKKSRQNFNFEGDSTSTGGHAEAGLRLSRVTGIPDCDEFWQHANLSGTAESSGVEELQEAATKGSTRYNPQAYEFIIDFGREGIKVYVDRNTVGNPILELDCDKDPVPELDCDGEFSNGKFGAYAMLHNSAVFWDFSYTDGSFPSSSEPVDQAGEVVLSSAVPEVGIGITAKLTDPDGGVTNTVWQWESSPKQDPPVWTAIPNANASSYTPTDADAGKLLRATVTYDDALGSGRTAVSPTSALDSPGKLTLSTTQPVAGEEIEATLSDDDGGITNRVWVWESSPDADPPTWSSIPDATSAAYTPKVENAGRIMRALVTYYDALRTGRTAVSEETSAVDQRGAVVLTPKSPVVGEAVTTTLTDPDGDIASEVWKWERSPGTGEPVWSTISGARSSTYTPISSDDAGKRLRVVVSYSDASGTGRSATSAASDRVDQRGMVTLSSTVPDVGIEVAAILRDADGGVTGKAWQWQKSPSTGTPAWSDISGADEDTYIPVAGDEGTVLRAVVDYDDAVGSGRGGNSDASEKVGKAGVVSLDGTMPAVGEKLTATLTDADGMISNEVWQWESSAVLGTPSWTVISGATSASYAPQTSDAGRVLRVVATYTDGSGDGRVAISAGTVSVGQFGIVTLSPDPPVAGKPVRATLVDDDGSITNQVWKWERSPGTGEPEWAVIGGAQSSSYTPTASDDAGKLLRVTVTYDDGTGTGRSATSKVSERVDREGVLTVSPSPPVAGQSVTATLVDDDGMVSNAVWKWERSSRMGTRNWEVITDASASSYVPSAAGDGGMILRVTVEYDDAIGTGRTAVSSSTLAVDRPGAVNLSTSKPVAGEVLRATLVDTDGGVLNKAWQWESSPDQETPSWTGIAGAEAAAYTPSASLAGKLLRVTVSYDDATARGRQAVSDATEALDQRGMVTVAPTNPVVGVEVAATLDDDDGSIENETWVWESSPDQGERDWTVIEDAESSTYTPKPEEAGKVLRVRVTYDDGTGTGRTAVGEATEPVDQRGMVTLSSDTPVVDQVLTARISDADGDITNEVWLWESSSDADPPNWVAIAGAGSESYTPTAGDAGRLLRVRVSYDDGVGTGRSAVSEPTAAVDQRGEVTLSPVTPVVGEVVTAALTDADGGVANEVWKWERSPGLGEPEWTAIDGAVSSSYTPVSMDDAGKRLRAVAMYMDGTGVGRSAASAASDRVDRRGAVMLSTSVPDVGVVVEATLTDADDGVTGESWQWQTSPATGMAAWTDIVGAEASTYTPAMSDEGNLLRVVVRYDDAVGSGRTAISVASEKVGEPGVVSLSAGMPVAGLALTAMLNDADGGIANEVWRWEWSPGMGGTEWMAITDATSASYTPVPGDAGHLLRAVVTYEDGSGSGRIARSQPTARADQLGTVGVKSRNALVDMPEVGVWQDAVLTDPDGNESSQVWRWERSPGGPEEERVWAVITGALSSSYKPVSDDAGKVLRVSVTYSDGTGTGREATSPPTERVDRPGTIELSSYSDVVVGRELRATIHDQDGGVTNVVWKWHHSPKQASPSWTVIDGAVSATYTPTEADGGLILRVTATYDDDVGVGRRAESASTAVVDRLGVITLSTQAPEAGELLEAELEDGDGGVREVRWRWESSPAGGDPAWEPVTGAPERSSYRLPSSISGRLLRVVADYIDAGAERTATSAATLAVSHPGVVTLDSTEATVGVAIGAELADSDGGVTGEVWYWQRSPDQAIRNWRDILGANSQAYSPEPGDAGMFIPVTQ